MSANTVSVLTIKLLGPPEVERAGRPVRTDTRKATAMLASLAVARRAQTRDELSSLLWPDYDPTKARASLRRTLSVLRDALDGGGIVAEGDVVRLDEAAVTVDLHEFRAYLRAWRAHGHNAPVLCDECVENLERAAALYRADFLAGFTLRDSQPFDDWQSLIASDLRLELGRCLDALAGALGARGDTAEAIGRARRRLSLDALHEPAHRILMRLYAQAGDRGAAARQYRECVRVLDAELGVGPLEETSELYRSIVASREPAGVPPLRPVSSEVVRVESPLVGRDAAWSALLDAHAAAARSGRFAGVRGEAGIGKSRLVGELLSRVRADGARVQSVRCYEGESSLAYGPIVEILRDALRDDPTWPSRLDAEVASELARLLPELGDAPADPVESPAAAARFSSSIAAALAEVCGAGGRVAERRRAAGRPSGAELSGGSGRAGVLVLDDVQWADEATAAAIAYLVRRLAGVAMLVVACWREGEAPGWDALLADGVRRGTALGLDLGRLSAPDVAVILDSSLPGRDDAAARLYAETEGLPLLVVEYVDALAADPAFNWTLPRGVREVLSSRIDGVSEAARQVLAAAAVLGTAFDAATVQTVAGRTEDETVAALEELVSRGLVAESGDAYDVRHPAVRGVAYDRTSLARRRVLHRRAGEHLAARPGRSSPAIVARHYVQAGEEEQAAAWSALAGEQARAVYANADAVVHFDTALALGHPDVGRIHEAMGDLYTLRGDYGAALDAYGAAAALAEGPRVAELERRLGAVHIRRGDWAQADAHLLAAAELGDASVRSRALAGRSLIAHRTGAEGAAETFALESSLAAGAAGDASALAEALNMRGMLASRRRAFDDAVAHFRHSLELAERLPEPAARVAAMNNLALTLAASGDAEAASALLSDALVECARQQDRHREAALHNNLADVLRTVGRVDEAMAHLKDAAAIFAEIGEGRTRGEIWQLTEW